MMVGKLCGIFLSSGPSKMITSVAWIPRGVARARPVRFELSPEEYQRIKTLAKEEQEAAKADESDEIENNYIAEEHLNDEDEIPREGEAVDLNDLPKELRMDEYDDDEESEGGGDDDDDEDGLGGQYEMMPEGDGAYAFGEDSDDDDAEDDEVRPTDTLLAVAMTEDEYSHLEIQLFTEDGTLYVHHDISLPEFPLCLAWLDCPPYQAQGGGQSTVGNYMAVGTFNPTIEIWNLDVLDPLEPTATLGGEIISKKKKGKKGGPNYKPGSHEGPVMSLSWNKTYRQMLASGSADTSVKIWDVTTQTCSHTFNHHRDKVRPPLTHSHSLLTSHTLALCLSAGSSRSLASRGVMDVSFCLI
jgi:periodic tryptophan protein 1